jgi:multicomponent Na+:H+ antiporter subunit E
VKRHTLGLAVVLCAFWLALSGHYAPMMLAFAAACIGLVLFLARRMDIVDGEAQILGLGRRAPLYLAWLGWQILRSAWDVTRRVWTGRPAVCPVMARIDATGMSEVVKVTYANSITLTPGTLAVSVGDTDIEVHALDDGLVRDLREGAMAARARRIEGD